MLLILPVGHIHSSLSPAHCSDMETHLPQVPQFVHGRNEDMNPVSLAPESYFGHRLAPPIPLIRPPEHAHLLSTPATSHSFNAPGLGLCPPRKEAVPLDLDPGQALL